MLILNFFVLLGAAKAKCLKLEKQNSVPTNGGGIGGGNKAKNMFLQVIILRKAQHTCWLRLDGYSLLKLHLLTTCEMRNIFLGVAGGVTKELLPFHRDFW